MPTLIDTHAWIWWVTEDVRLSKPARTAILKAQHADTLWLSGISIWELAKKVEKQQIVLDRPLGQWVDAALSLEGLSIWEITKPVLLESCALPQPFHGDPADQMLVATARLHGAALVTKDKNIRRYAHVETIW